MPGCLTCKRRKVKCDGRPGVCGRCQKLNIRCVPATGTSDAIDNSSTPAPTATREGMLTQAGYKRLRASAACERCRVKKLKCNAARPSCSCCRQKQTPCRYAEPDLPASMQARGQTADVEENAASSFLNVLSETASASISHPYKHLSTARSMQRQGIDVPSGTDLLPYLDSFLANVHPISCNNFLHPGCLCEGLDDAPPLLLLSICASSSKFLTTPNAHEKGVQWASEATWLTMNSLDYASTLTVSAIQFLALHYVHLAQFTTAANLAGIAIRMARDMKLRIPSPNGIFLEQECRRRLMWTVFVSDLLFHPVDGYIESDSLAELPLPCNIWSFTQGVPCRTLTMRQLQDQQYTVAAQQATNHCAFFITILCLRRKILTYVQALDRDYTHPWLPESTYFALRRELQAWRGSMPTNYAFNARSMYMFRVSRHLDIFFMTHAYYHQCYILLNMAFIQLPHVSPSSSPSLSANDAQEKFMSTCAAESLEHAMQLASITKQLLALEANHVFRDPWFTTCAWDAALAILSRPAPEGVAADQDKVDRLQCFARALGNSARSLPVARIALSHLLAVLRHDGIEASSMGTTATEIIEFKQEWLNRAPKLAYATKYPFLCQQVRTEPPGWERLFRTTEGRGSALTTRPSSPRRDVARSAAATPGNANFNLLDTDIGASAMPFDFQMPMHYDAAMPLAGGAEDVLAGDDAVSWWQMLQTDELPPDVQRLLVDQDLAST